MERSRTSILLKADVSAQSVSWVRDSSTFDQSSRGFLPFSVNITLD
ncbi:MAG: hypothetical protein SVR08_17130 [Spirochaetota bacterium]|nr:hypothetical protein [Spirochaetota bacterium]